MSEPLSNDRAPFAYEGLDRVIHERARLGVLTSLAGHPKGLTFADLKRLVNEAFRSNSGNTAQRQIASEGDDSVQAFKLRCAPASRC